MRCNAALPLAATEQTSTNASAPAEDLRLRCCYRLFGERKLERAVSGITSKAISHKLVSHLKLQDGVFRHRTVLAIDIERRVGTEGIERGLKPLDPDGIKHRRCSCGRRKLLVNAREFLFTDLLQQGQEITRVFLHGLY